MSKQKTEGKYVGTKLPNREYTKLGMISVRTGQSRSKIIRNLALALIKRDDARIAKERGAA